MTDVLIGVAVGAGVPVVLVLVRYLPYLVRRVPRISPDAMEHVGEDIIRAMKGR